MDGDSRMANERGVEERRGKEYMWTERNREEEERERERERQEEELDRVVLRFSYANRIVLGKYGFG